MVSRRASQCTLYREDERQQLCFLLSFARGAMMRIIFYTSYRKKLLRRAYFLRHMARGDDAIACKSMSFIARMQATSCHCNTRLLIARRTMMIVFFMLYHERSNANDVFDVASSGRIARGACYNCDSIITRREDTTIEFLYAVNQMMTATCVLRGATMANKG